MPRKFRLPETAVVGWMAAAYCPGGSSGNSGFPRDSDTEEDSSEEIIEVDPAEIPGHGDQPEEEARSRSTSSGDGSGGGCRCCC